MNFLFRHLLLLGVIFGLAGQGVAYASPPCAAMASSTSAQMADCIKGVHKSDKGPVPCKGMTPGCVAMAGCASLGANDMTSAIVGAPPMVADIATWPATPVLIGRSIAPDPDPPAILG